MRTLSERLRLAQIWLMTKNNTEFGTIDALAQLMDELIDISIEATNRRNFKLLGSMEATTGKLGVACFKHVKDSPWITKKFIKNFMVEAEDLIEFLKYDYASLEESLQIYFLDALVENMLQHETFYSRAKPRVAQDVVAAFLHNTDRPAPLIRLCEAVSMTNTKDVAGASFVIMAIESIVALETQQEIELAKNVKLYINVLNEHVDVNNAIGDDENKSLRDLESLQAVISSSKFKPSKIIEAALHWIKDFEVSIAESIHEGEVSEYISSRVIAIARDFNLPLIAAQLSTRVDYFDYTELAEMVENFDFYTDLKHGTAIFQQHSLNIDACAGVLAYSMVYKDVLPDHFTKSSGHEILKKAVELLAGEKINMAFGQSVLERFFAEISTSADMSKLSRSHIHGNLMKIKKYNGMRLEIEMGM